MTNAYFHIDRFLVGHPLYAKKLAEVILEFSGSARISAVLIARQCYVPGSVAEDMMTSLKSAKVVRHLHEPLRDVLAVDRETAEQLAEYALRFK